MAQPELYHRRRYKSSFYSTDVGEESMYLSPMLGVLSWAESPRPFKLTALLVVLPSLHSSLVLCFYMLSASLILSYCIGSSIVA